MIIAKLMKWCDRFIFIGAVIFQHYHPLSPPKIQTVISFFYICTRRYRIFFFPVKKALLLTHSFWFNAVYFFALVVYFLPFGSPTPSDEENEVLGKPYDKNNHLELDCPIPHVFLTVEKMLPDEEYSYPEDFDFDGMDAFTEMSDTQTDLVARVFFTVDEAKRHVLGFKAIQIGAVKHRGSYESERLDSYMSLDDLMKDAFFTGMGQIKGFWLILWSFLVFYSH